jgi:hypothetical protein
MLRIANNTMAAAGVFAGVRGPDYSPRSSCIMLRRTRLVTSRIGITADLRFELGELHVLMISNSAK